MIKVIAEIQGVWTILHSAQDISFVNKDEGGDDYLSFTMPVYNNQIWQQMRHATKIVVTYGGTNVWSGYINSTPYTNATGRQLNVEAVGWYKHLNDTTIGAQWTHSVLADWIDCRKISGQDLSSTGFAASGETDNIGGDALIYFPAGGSYAQNHKTGFVLDLGAANVGKRVYVNMECSLGSAYTVRVCSHNSGFHASGNEVNLGSTTGTYTATFTTARRYVLIYALRTAASVTNSSGNPYVKIKSIKVASDSSYLHSSNGSSLIYASDIITKAMQQDTTFFSTDYSLIQATTLGIDNAGTGINNRLFLNELITKANQLHGYQFFLTSELKPRAVYRPIPTNIKYQLMNNFSELDAPSTNDGQNLADSVTINYTDSRGINLNATSSVTNNKLPANFHRRKVITSNSPLTALGAQTVADAALAQHQEIPFNGSVKVHSYLKDHATQAVLPAAKIRAGEFVLLPKEYDSNFGRQGRIALIKEVSYEAKTNTATLTLDNNLNYFETLTARLDAYAANL